MSDPQTVTPEAIPPDPPRGGTRFVKLLAVGLLFILMAALRPDPIRAAWAEIERIIQLKSTPLPASPSRLSDHELEELNNMQPQQQANLLLERAINHYEGAIEQIESRVPRWYGQLEVEKGHLAGLLNTAINANDLRVRAASLEITLAGYNLPKTPESVEKLLVRLQDEPEHRAWLLWILGVLGNRGVETARLETVFLDRIHDPDQATRAYAIVGLGLLATDSAIAPLLGAFHDDPSPHIREGAACALAQSGMFKQEQRMTAVSGILRFTDDPTLDPTTRSWAFQALRDITGQSFGSDPAAWRSWWASHI